MATAIEQGTRGARSGNGRYASSNGNGGSRAARDEQLANALGWFSIGLGVAQIAAPGRVARLIGVRDDGRSRSLLRAVGVREITAGVGLLSQPRPVPWAWARVAGDVMDLALLGRALSSEENERNKTAAATAAVVGIAALDVLCGQRLARDTTATGLRRTGKTTGNGIQVSRSITVNRPPEEVYAFWHDFENLPRFMSHLESVQVLDSRRSHWKATGPAGKTVEWDAEVTEDRPNELIAWRSVEGADVDNAGLVRFRKAPGGRGTEIQVELRYDPPAGKLGATVAKLFREEPGQQVQDDLRAFKQVVETGEVVLSDASVHRGPHPAQPPAKPLRT